MAGSHQVLINRYSSGSIIISGYSVSDTGEAVADLTLPTGPTGDGGCTAVMSGDGKCAFLWGYRASGLPSNSDYMFLRRKGKTWVSSPFTPIPINGNSSARIQAAALSYDGIYLYIGFTMASPYHAIYKRDGDTWTKLAGFTPPVATQGGMGCFSHDGLYFFFSQGSNSTVYMMKRTGDAWAQVASVTPGAYLGNPIVTADGQFLAGVSGASGAYVLRLFSIGADTLTPYATFSGGNYGGAFALDAAGEYIVLSSSANPSFKFLKRTGTTFEELALPSGLMVYSAGTRRVEMTNDGKHLFLCMSNTSPYVQHLMRTGDTWALQEFPAQASNIQSVVVPPPTIIPGQFSFYNSAMLSFLSGSISLASLKVALLDDSYEFLADHTTLAQVTASGTREVYGQGWPQGGISCPASFVDAGSGAVDLVVSDVSQAMTGVITPYAAVIYDDADGSDKPLALVHFEEPVSSVNGENLAFDFPPTLMRFGALGTSEVT